MRTKIEVTQNRGLTFGLGSQIYIEIKSIVIEFGSEYCPAKFALRHFESGQGSPCRKLYITDALFCCMSARIKIRLTANALLFGNKAVYLLSVSVGSGSPFKALLSGFPWLGPHVDLSDFICHLHQSLSAASRWLHFVCMALNLDRRFLLIYNSNLDRTCPQYLIGFQCPCIRCPDLHLSCKYYL